MDIRNILNTDGDTSKNAAVHRVGSFAQPSPHPSLPRQTSMPNIPPDYRQSYSPLVPTPTHQSPTQTSYFRDRSLSVSPKTKVTSLSAPHINSGYEYDVIQNPTPVSNNGHPVDIPHYQQASIHTSPGQTLMAPPSYNSNSPVQTIRPQPVQTHPYVAAHQTPPAQQPSYPVHIQQTHHSPVSYSHSSHSSHGAQNSISTLRRASQISAMTESPIAASRKRSLESSTSETSQQPAPKRRRHETPPIWAVRFDRSKEKVYDGPRIEITPHQHQQLSLQTTQRSVTPADIKSEQRNESKVNGHSSTPPRPQSRAWQQETPPGWEPNFDNMIPYNDVVMEVADRIYDNIVECPWELPEGSTWEIEAKLGHIIDKKTGERLYLPVRSETILDQGWASENIRFDSKMSMAQHKALNVYLNHETGKSQQRREKIQYQHMVQVDKFYEVPAAMLERLPEFLQKCRARKPHVRPRVRISTDAKTGAVRESIIKFRIEDLEVYCPRRADQCDYRVSISLEWRYPWPTEHLLEVREDGAELNRRKDRMSYAHQAMRLDLTQVKGEAAEPSHEMEVELLPELVIEEGRKAARNEDNKYEALIGTYLNYVRALSRAEVGVPR